MSVEPETGKQSTVEVTRDATSTPNPASTVVVTLSPLFKLVFISVLGITLICLFLSLYVSLHIDAGAKNVEAMKSLNEKLLSVFTLGCGAIIGLLGGKTLN